jgi:acetyltransferase-like isoleucine patch superfamily enzyme
VKRTLPDRSLEEKRKTAMPSTIERNLSEIEHLFDSGLDEKKTLRVLEILGATGFSQELLTEVLLYSDYLPKAQDMPFTPHQRFLHFLWDVLDKLPAASVANFAIPLRRLIAMRLFKKCGKNLIVEENVRFNFGQNIEAGDDVFLNRGIFIDAKGGVRLGNFVGLAERVMILTHTHSESDHTERHYAPVVIEDFAIVYVGSTIMPGVTVGREALVAAMSVVTHDVKPGMMVHGIPAEPVRERHDAGKHGPELNHYWLHDKMFQK